MERITGVTTPERQAGRDLMQRVWEEARQYYQRPPSEPMPRTAFMSDADSPFVGFAFNPPDTLAQRIASGQIIWPDFINHDFVTKRPPEFLALLLHEWAHYFQLPGLSLWEAEGGAQAFARRIAPSVYLRLGIPYRNLPMGEDQYTSADDTTDSGNPHGATGRVLAEKSDDWIMRGQFRPPPAGLPAVALSPDPPTAVAKRAPTPAARARDRRDPAIALPPKPPEADRRSTMRNMHIVIAGVPYLIGPSIEGDPAMAATYDGTATVTIAVRDVDGALQEALSDEAQSLIAGARVTINDVVYVLQNDEVDDTGSLVTLTLEDEVSWRLKQFSRFLAISRQHSTRAQAALRLVTEASTAPLAPMKYFIPELTDKQRIAAPSADQATSTSKGTGSTSSYKVKRVRAKAPQRASIDAILSEDDQEGATRRVMIATIMAATQESALDPAATNGDHVGLYNQDPGWGSLSARRDRTKSTKAFLAAWKKVHGSLKHAPGDLAAAIEAVQHSGQGSLYAQWEDEATATVDAWRGSGGSSSRTVVEPFEFTRGSKDGQRESSWDALSTWAQDVNWRRWAQNNTLFYVSDDELRAAAPALEIHGDESWLLAPPAGARSPDRPETEVTVRVLAERWGVMIGASVLVATGTARGRFIVAATDGYMVNPELTVTLRRPSEKKPEPAHTTHEATSGGAGASSDLLDACKTVSKQARGYQYGGGHGPKLSKISAHAPLDCSASVSLVLHMAGMFDGSVAITSGAFASSWGKPGKGREFTVWANSTHVWIELYDAGRYKRFDTSAHGSGDTGPRLRTTARNDQDRFTPRHWPGH